MKARDLGRRSWFALAALVLIPGCLDFKKQTVLIKFEEKSEKVTILSVYEGYFVGGGLSKSAALKDAREGLDRFVGDDPEVAIFSDFIGISLKPEAKDSPGTAAVKRRMASLVKIDPGKLLLNEKGELSGALTVTIFDRRAFEKVVNELISETVVQGVTASGAWSAESSRLMVEAAKRGHRWVSITAGQVVIDVPMTVEDADKLMVQLTEAKASKDYAEFRESIGPFDVKKTDHGIAASFGDGKSRIMTIQHEFKEATPRMQQELLDYARTLPTPIDNEQDTRALMERFRSSR